MVMRRVGALAVACLLLSGAAAELDAQCALCRTALVSSEEGRAMAEKFNTGILFLLGAPFSVAAAVGVAMVRSRRRLSRSSDL